MEGTATEARDPTGEAFQRTAPTSTDSSIANVDALADAAAAAAAAADPTSSAASRAGGKTAEQLAATIAGVQSACSPYAFVAPPQQASCPGRWYDVDHRGKPATACAAALAEVLDGPCALQLQASAPAGLVHTTQQLCRGACADDVQRLSLRYEETCGTSGCDAECAAVLREIGGHASRDPASHTPIFPLQVRRRPPRDWRPRVPRAAARPHPAASPAWRRLPERNLSALSKSGTEVKILAYIPSPYKFHQFPGSL